MSTPFWQYRQKSLFNKTPKDLVTYGIEDCARDWSRDQGDIFINGVALGQKEEDRSQITAGCLEQLWRTKLLVRLDEEQQTKCLKFFSENFHQTGIPSALQRGLKTVAKEKDCVIGGNDINATVSFDCKDGKLIIKEDVALKGMTLNYTDKHNTRKLTDSEKYLLTATAIYSIDLTAEEPSVEYIDLVLNQHNRTTAKIFDTRNMLEKIRDFFKSLIGVNTLFDPVDRSKSPFIN